MPIHPTAIVHKGAEVDASAEIGPFCVVGPKVKIGPQTRLLSHVVVDGETTLGARNIIHPYAAVGGTPQDLKFKGEPGRVVIGDDNIIRECATIHIGTQGGHMETRIGNNCLLMAYTHVAHDCTVGNRVIMANAVGLAGHVDIADNVIMNGLAGVHQFCQVGRNAYIAGGARVAQSVPPFCVAKGDRAKLTSINIIGLRRAAWPRERIHALRHAFQTLFLTDEPFQRTLARVEAELAAGSSEIAEMCRFIRAQKRGVCPGRRGPRGEDNVGDGTDD
jgi:UDP-N-acetylglucosamine acyltransferase